MAINSSCWSELYENVWVQALVTWREAPQSYDLAAIKLCRPLSTHFTEFLSEALISSFSFSMSSVSLTLLTVSVEGKEKKKEREA